MTANTSPIYTITPINTFALITAADTGTSGTGSNVTLVFTSGSNGSFVQKLIFQPLSTSGSTTTNAAAARVYINNGSSAGTASNNVLFKEISLAATAVNTSATTAAFGYELPINFQLAASYTIIVGITSFASSTQWNVLSVAGNY